MRFYILNQEPPTKCLLRYDWLSQDIFEKIEEVQDKTTNYMWHYNNERPNMALGGIMPQQKLLQAA